LKQKTVFVLFFTHEREKVGTKGARVIKKILPFLLQTINHLGEKDPEEKAERIIHQLSNIKSDSRLDFSLTKLIVRIS
jgi:hypothetical protein